VLGFEVRAGEGRLVGRAAVVAALAGAGVAMVASASDALFVSRVGVRQLGTLFAVSSAALIVVLGYVGSLADRVDRGRLLLGLAGIAALVVAGLAAGLELAPGPVSVLAVVLGKQLAAAFDLAFWVLIAERLDARQGRRLVPLLVTASGVGTTLGAFAVDPIAGVVGARGVLAVAAVVYLACGAAAAGLSRADLGRAIPDLTSRRPPAWRGGWQAVRQRPLAGRLALLVGVAGAFAPILYYLFGVAAAARFSDEAALAGFLGHYRGAVQVAILLAAFLTPGLLARLGVAPALLVAPVGAIAAAAVIGLGGGLVVIAAAQASARLLDTAVETPAEKLVLNLLPRQVRGRVQGFVDGVAKRAGAIAGGLAASALVVWPHVLAAVTVTVAALWTAAAWRLRRRFAELAVAELAARPRAGESGDDAAAQLGDERSLRTLRRELVRGGGRRALAVELLLELDSGRGRVDAAAELAQAAARVAGEERRELLRALDRLTQAGSDRRLPPAAADALLGLLGEAEEERALAVAVLGRVTASGDHAAVLSLTGLADDAQEAHVRMVARLALARIRGDGDAFEALIDDCLDDGGPGERAAAIAELRADLARALGQAPPDLDRAMARARALLRALRRQPPEPAEVAGLSALAEAIGAARAAGAGAELVLLSTDARALATRALAGTSAPVRAAAVALLAALGEAADAHAVAGALADADDDVRQAAARGLRTMGQVALEVLLVMASYGGRQARNAALEIVRDLRPSSAELDDLIERELGEIEATTARLAVLGELPGAALLVRRLDERVGEAAHTLLLALEAKLGQATIGEAARRFLRARDPIARARALEALDTVLPRSIARRVLAPLDAGPAAERSLAAARRLGTAPPAVEEAVRAELDGPDHLARALVLYALGEGGRARHRDAIAAAAARAARDVDPMQLIRRLAGAAPANEDQPTTDSPAADAATTEDEMPRTVDTLIALSQVPIFSELTTRQLADLAEVVGWHNVRAGQAIVEQGEAGGAMFFIVSGEVEVTAGGRTLGRLVAGEVFGEMALFEDESRSATVTACGRVRVGRIERADFEELVEDVPGIALAICRVLSRRVRTLNAELAA